MAILPRKLSTGLFLLIGVFVFASLAGAPRQVEAASVYSQPYIGQNWGVGDETISAVGYYTNFPGFVSLANPPVANAITVPSYDRVRIKVVSTNTTCNAMISNSAFFRYAKGTATSYQVEPTSCSISGNYWTFIFPSATTTLYELVTVVTNVAGSPNNLILDGSTNNDSRSVNGSNTGYSAGGFAFDLCLTTCDATYVYNPGDVSTTTSRIISVSPNSAVATTTATGAATTTSIVGYVTTDDYATTTQLEIKYFNQGCTSLSVSAIEAVNGDCSFTRTYPISASGFFTVGTTSETFNYLGTWTWKARIVNADNSWCLFGVCLINNSVDLTTSSGTFVVGGVSAYDNFIAEIASTSQAIPTDLTKCTPSTFELGGCVASLFLPNASSTQLFMSTYSSEFLRRFPLGYVTDAIRILSTTTVGTLTAIDATIPTTLVGGGAHVRLDITNGLSTLLNATTSTFINSSAPSTDTFYQITSYYWNLVVYVSLFFYLLTRIVGSNIIGKITHKTHKVK